MAKNNLFATAEFGLALIALPFKLIMNVINAVERAEKEASLKNRREVLNMNTISTMQSRSIMDQKRMVDIELSRERLLNESLRGELLASQINLNLKRAEQMENLSITSIDLDKPGDNVWNTCPACGNNQSVALGIKCAACGANVRTVRFNQL